MRAATVAVKVTLLPKMDGVPSVARPTDDGARVDDLVDGQAGATGEVGVAEILSRDRVGADGERRCREDRRVPASGTTPRLVAPSKNSTLPVGLPNPPTVETVAVKVTFSPLTDGLRLLVSKTDVSCPG